MIVLEDMHYYLDNNIPPWRDLFLIGGFEANGLWLVYRVFTVVYSVKQS